MMIYVLFEMIFEKKDELFFIILMMKDVLSLRIFKVKHKLMKRKWILYYWQKVATDFPFFCKR